MIDTSRMIKEKELLEPLYLKWVYKLSPTTWLCLTVDARCVAIVWDNRCDIWVGIGENPDDAKHNSLYSPIVYYKYAFGDLYAAAPTDEMLSLIGAAIVE